jgi:hypothetical protein
MGLPEIDNQLSIFDAGIMFPRLVETKGAERFRFFAERIGPELRKRRPELEGMYNAGNGRPAEEPVRMLGIIILQFMERLPDRQAAKAYCQNSREVSDKF